MRDTHSDTSSLSVSRTDRKSTRLNSSHVAISYAVFCLKKKNFIIGKYRKAFSTNNVRTTLPNIHTLITSKIDACFFSDDDKTRVIPSTSDLPKLPATPN